MEVTTAVEVARPQPRLDAQLLRRLPRVLNVERRFERALTAMLVDLLHCRRRSHHSPIQVAVEVMADDVQADAQFMVEGQIPLGIPAKRSEERRVGKGQS